MSAEVKVHFKLDRDGGGYPPVAVESLWAAPGGSSQEYVIDNIPFFARTATIGDVVRVRREGSEFWFVGLVRRSENSLLRVVFFDLSCVDNIGKDLLEMGCYTEYLHEYRIMAVSVPSEVKLVDVQVYLQLEADAGRIDYEEPILRQR